MVQPLFESIHSRLENSFSIRTFEQHAFTSPYHYHPEFELTLIRKGKGKRYIGNQMNHFCNQELVFMGPNLPHCWKTDPLVQEKVNASSIVVQFNINFLGEDFFQKPELAPIKKFLDMSQRGIVFGSTVIPAISDSLEAMVNEPVNFKKLHIFLDILHRLSTTTNFKLLNSLSYIPLQNAKDMERINKIFTYIVENFKTNVKLEDVACEACMTQNAFCKYFKKMTHKTFIEVVLEYRLDFAISLLLNTDKSIEHICFECGFNDTVYFIRMFKSKMRLSPLQYKKKFMHSFHLFDDSNQAAEFMEIAS